MERSLIAQAQRGDREAFASLVSEIGDGLFRLAHRILRDPDLAQDAFQEALIAAWRQLPALRDVDRFEAWIHRILVNACYAESRKRSRWSANVRVLDVDAWASHEAGLSIDDRDALERAFRLVSVDQRAVFVMHHYVGLPLVEIAETLGIPAGTARSRLHYATQTLRRALDETEEIGVPKERPA